MHFLKHLILTLALALAATSVTGCDKDQSTTGEAAQAATSGFAKGYNALIDKPSGLIKRYFEEIPETGPDATEKHTLFPDQNWAEKANDEAAKAFAEAKKSVPDSMKAIPALGDAALAASKQLVTTYAAAQTYYAAENYKDDAFAKGKELHGQMQTASKAFRETTDALSNALDAVEDAQAEAEIKKFGKDSYGFWFRHYNMVGKKFIATVTGAADAPATLKAAADGFAAVDEAMTGLAAFATSKGDKAQATFKSYVTQAQSFHTEAKKLQRMASEAPKDRELSSAIDAQIQRYNTLVQLYSSLTQLEGQGLLK